MEPGLPDPAAIRRRVTRGQGLVVPLDEAMTMPAVVAVAEALRTALPPDMHVIASPPRAGRGPSLTVLQLVTDSEAAVLRPALERLVAEFRQVAAALVDQLPPGVSPWRRDLPETVQFQGSTWHLEPHGKHCRFEDSATGTVVEAEVHAPDAVDPYFLLEFARTSGRHDAILDACAEGFHDMCRLLDRAGVT